MNKELVVKEAAKWCNDNPLGTRMAAFISGYNFNAAHQSVEFAKWINESYDHYARDIYIVKYCPIPITKDKWITTEQLYEIYLKEQGV